MAKRSTFAVNAYLVIICITYIQYCSATSYGYNDENSLQAYIKYALNTVYNSYQNVLNYVYEQQENIGKGYYWKGARVSDHNIDDRIMIFTWLIIGYLSWRLFSSTVALMILSLALICYMSFGPLWSKHVVWTVTNEASKVAFIFDEIAARPLVSAICVFILCSIKILYDMYRRYQKENYVQDMHTRIFELTGSVESVKANHDRLIDSMNKLHDKIDRILSVQGVSSKRS